MDPRTIRLRLSGHGDLIAHRDGSFTLSLQRPAGEFWKNRMGMAVRTEVPGAVLSLYRCRRAADRYFEIHEVFFRVGPSTDAPSVPSGTPTSRATSAGTADAGGRVVGRRGDVTAGRDRHA